MIKNRIYVRARDNVARRAALSDGVRKFDPGQMSPRTGAPGQSPSLEMNKNDSQVFNMMLGRDNSLEPKSTDSDLMIVLKR